MPEDNPVPPPDRPTPVVIVQPCGEACACFRRLPPGYEWYDFGICANPRSPNRGCPVRIGRDCRRYVPNRDPHRIV